MKTLLGVLRNRKLRESLFWNLRREIEEHKHGNELNRLAHYADTNNREEFDKLSEILRQNPYLEGCIIRLDYLADFLHGSD